MNEPNLRTRDAIARPSLSLATSTVTASGPTIPTSDNSASPRDLANSILRNKWLACGIVLISLVATYLLLSTVSSRYTADALIIVDSHGGNALGTTSLSANSFEAAGSIDSEVEVLFSRGLATKVISLLDLDNNPEFNQDSKGVDPGNNQDQRTVNTLTNFHDGLSIVRKGISRVIQVKFTAKDPIIARDIVNSITAQYILQQRELKFNQTGKAAEWLDEKVAPLQKKVEESETAVEVFRNNSDLLQGASENLTTQHMNELSNQIIRAEANRISINARLRQINKLMKSPGGAGTASEIMKSPLILNLRATEANLQQRIGEMSAEFGDLHPLMIQLRAEMNDVSANIHAEIEHIAHSLENDIEIARAQKASAKRNLNALKDQVVASNNAKVQLRALEREAQANRALLETYLSKLKETSTRTSMDFQQSNARILSDAINPVSPSFPKTGPIMALAFVASSILALLFILIRESTDRGLTTVGLVEEHTGIPSLGYIPLIRKRDALRKSPESYLLKRPLSTFADAIRTLYTSVLLARPGLQPKSILVTSAQQKEGKTTIANTLAMSRAAAGQKTIVVNADLRQSAKNGKASKAKQFPGLVELLNGEAAIEEAIQNNPDTGIDTLDTGSAVENPSDLLMSENMDTLLRILVDSYDLVVFDSPPVLDAPDARILMEKVDTTIFVAKWHHTKRQLIREALRHMVVPGHNIAGVLINMVNEKEQESYGYGGSNYGYSQLPLQTHTDTKLLTQ